MIVEICDNKLKRKIAIDILGSLTPSWFLIDEPSRYIDNDANMFFAFKARDEFVAFVAIKKHYESSYEIHVMGVKPTHFNNKIGTKLLDHVEDLLRSKNGKLFFLETVGENSIDDKDYYEPTRAFYEHRGFIKMFLSNDKSNWNEGYPRLIYAKSL